MAGTGGVLDTTGSRRCSLLPMATPNEAPRHQDVDCAQTVWRPCGGHVAMDRRFAARLVGPGLAVSYVGVRRGGCLAAFFACLYFAMLRPSETVALHAD